MRRHRHRRPLSFYVAWFGCLVLPWSLVIAAGYGLTALAAFLVVR